MNNVYYVGSGELTFDLIERIINENLKLELAPEAKLRIQKCRDYLDKKIAESEEPLYGITTGFGSLCSKSISSDELGTLQENLIKSHACSVGEEIRPVIIKLMMLLKAHALSLGHSGVQVITVQRILDFFNNDVMPIVYDRGSLGASGDLAPLANLFLPLIGVGDVYYKGKKREAISVLDEFGWEPVKLMSKEEGNVDQDQRIPHDLRVRLSDSGQHGLFDLAVRRRDDDGLHAALQGAYPAGIDLRSGVDALLYDPYLFECDVHPGRGLRLFR